MPSLTIELPEHNESAAFNLRRWTELVEKPLWADVEGRIETDRHGNVVMSPPSAASHGRYQSRIAYLLQDLLPEGETLTECPISTADGVKASDVAWASAESMKRLGDEILFMHAPEICVEIRSPGNSDGKIREKKRLYFDAGAQEVWVCDKSGRVEFFVKDAEKPNSFSAICPAFPSEIQLRRC